MVAHTLWWGGNFDICTLELPHTSAAGCCCLLVWACAESGRLLEVVQSAITCLLLKSTSAGPSRNSSCLTCVTSNSCLPFILKSVAVLSVCVICGCAFCRKHGFSIRLHLNRPSVFVPNLVGWEWELEKVISSLIGIELASLPLVGS